MRQTSAWGLAALLGLAWVAGCDETRQAADRTVHASDRAEDGAERTADRTGGRSTQAAERLERTLENAGSAIAADTREGLMALQVKSALMTTPKQLEWNNIDVDTDKGIVHLRGTVPSAEQKKVADNIARQVAGKEFKVTSHLQVSKGAD